MERLFQRHAVPEQRTAAASDHRYEGDPDFGSGGYDKGFGCLRGGQAAGYVRFAEVFHHRRGLPAGVDAVSVRPEVSGAGRYDRRCEGLRALLYSRMPEFTNLLKS